jgi:hypothetical protein
MSVNRSRYKDSALSSVNKAKNYKSLPKLKVTLISALPGPTLIFSTCLVLPILFLFLSGSFLRVDLVNLDHFSAFHAVPLDPGFSRVLVDSESSLTLVPFTNSLVSPSRSIKSDGEEKTNTFSIRSTKHFYDQQALQPSRKS